MAHIKQSASWWCYYRQGMDAAQLMRDIKAIGIEAVELIGQEYWQLAKDNGLVIASHGAHQSISEGLNRRENHDRIEKEIAQNIKLAIEWKIPNLIVFSGNREGLDDETGAEITAEGLKRVAKMAEDAGITLVMELLNSKVDHKDYQCDNTPWGVKVCKMVGSPRVKLLNDIYHMQIMEGDIIRNIRDYHEFYGHYHTAGNPGRNDMDDTQELNYPPIMRAILATGYDMYVGHEFIPKGDPVEALKAAYALCNV